MSADDETKPQGEEVGYGRPPQHSRFKPGQSGNPSGRAKGSRNLKTDLAEELAETIRIREGEAEQTVSKQRAMLKALVAKALKGDARAASLVFAMVAKHVEAEVADDPAEKPLSASEDAILDDLLRRHAEAAARRNTVSTTTLTSTPTAD